MHCVESVGKEAIGALCGVCWYGAGGDWCTVWSLLVWR